MGTVCRLGLGGRRSVASAHRTRAVKKSYENYREKQAGISKVPDTNGADGFATHSSFRLIDDLATQHRHRHLCLEEFRRLHGEDIFGQYHQVCQLSSGNRSLDLLLMRSERGVDRIS